MHQSSSHDSRSHDANVFTDLDVTKDLMDCLVGELLADDLLIECLDGDVLVDDLRMSSTDFADLMALDCRASEALRILSKVIEMSVLTLIAESGTSLSWLTVVYLRSSLDTCIACASTSVWLSLSCGPASPVSTSSRLLEMEMESRSPRGLREGGDRTHRDILVEFVLALLPVLGVMRWRAPRMRTRRGCRNGRQALTTAMLTSMSDQVAAGMYFPAQSHISKVTAH